MIRMAALLALVAGAVTLVWWTNRTSTSSVSVAVDPGAAIVEVTVPALEGAELRGQRAFTAFCADCHGDKAGGIEGAGPPLIHVIYEPSHHGDMAFFLAAERGVQSHHWRFGDMAPVEGITRAEVADIVAFVRRVQRANGID